MSNTNLKIQLVLDAVNKMTAPLRGVQKQLQAVTEKMQTHRKALGELEQLQRINEKTFERYNKAISPLREKLNNTTNALKIERTELNRLKQAMNSTQTPSLALQQRFKAVSANVKKLSHAQSNEIIKLKAEMASFRNAGFTLRKYRQDQQELAAKIKRSTQAMEEQRQKIQELNAATLRKRKYNQQQAFLTDKANKIKAFGANAVGGAVAGGLGLSRLLGAGVEFEKSMSKVQALTRLDVTKKEDADRFQALVKQAKALGSATKFSAGQVADAQGYLAMAGFTVEQIQSALPSVLNAAIASGFDVAEVSDIASDLGSALQQPADKMGKVADVLTYASTSANVDLRTMYETLKEGAPIMTSLGQNMETVAAMSAALGNVGIKGTSAGTALKNIGVNLADSKKTKHLRKLGIAIQDATGNMRELPDILTDIREKTAFMGNVEKENFLAQVFGKEALAGVTELINQSDGRLKKYIENFKKSAGVTNKIAKIMGENLAGDLDNLKSAWEGVEIELFTTFKDDLRDLAQLATSAMRSFGAFVKEHQTLIKWISYILVPLGALMGVIGGLALLFSFFVSPVYKVITALSFLGKGFLRLIPVVWSFTTALLANPVGLIITAIIGLVAVFVWLYKKCDWLRNGIYTVWNGIVSIVSGAINGIAKILSFFSPIKAIKQAFMALFNWLGIDAGEKMKQGGVSMMQALLDGLLEIFPKIGEFFTGLISKAKDTWNSVKGFFGFGDDDKETVLKEVRTVAQPLVQRLPQTTQAPPMVAPKMTIDRRPPLRQASPSHTVNAPLNATININAQGMSHAELQTAVRNALDQAHQTQQAKARASLYDRY